MTEQEQIDRAFEEFTNKYDLYGNEWQDIGCDEVFKAGWLAAKLSQKPIELPACFWAENLGDTVFLEYEMLEAITKAGYEVTPLVYKLEGTT